MDLNLGSRAMITAMRAAHPETGLKKLTIEVNELLPPKMRVEKHKLRDFVRSLEEPNKQPVTAAKPRDDDFLNNTVSKVFVLLREAEREFLVNLDRESVTKIHNARDSTKCHPVAHLRYHLQVLLVLMSFKPCVPFVSPEGAGVPVARNMVLRCLVPLMEQFDLESYGFKLLYVATDVLTYDGRFRGFKGSWVLADTQSPGWRAVREMFVAMPTRRVPHKVLCGALGFPVQDNNLINQVKIMDATEHELLRESFDQDTCKVDVLKIYCDKGSEADWEKIKEYYLGCKELAAPLGTVLTLSLKEHPAMEEWCSVNKKLVEPADAAKE